MNYRIDLGRQQDKITRDRRASAASRLAVDRRCDSHRRRDLHLTIDNLLSPSNAELIDAVVVFTWSAQNLFDAMEIDVWRRAFLKSWAGRRFKRCFGVRKCTPDSHAKLDSIAVSMDMHVHHARRFIQDVIVERRLFYAALLQGPHDRPNLS